MALPDNIDHRRRTRQRVGACVLKSTFDYLLCEESVVRNHAEPFCLALLWPRLYYVPQVKANTVLEPFRHGADALALMSEFQIDPLRFGADWKNKYQWLAAKLQGKTRITLEVKVDTDDLDYCSAAQDALDAFERMKKDAAQKGHEPPKATDLKLPFKIHLFARGGAFSETGDLVLLLDPREPEFFDSRSPVGGVGGWMALDFGNTNSTLAFLPVDKEDPDDILLVDASKEHATSGLQVDPVETCLALTHLDESIHSQSPNCAAWIIGSRARRLPSGSDGLLVGLKRIVASSKWKGPEPILAHPYLPRRSTGRPRQHDVPAAFPAELYLCRVFHAFAEAKLLYPARLAFTYPTTFDNRELSQMRETIYRALLRGRAEPQDAMSKTDQSKGLPLEVDEASAAAFYFLFRKTFHATHGVAAFQYHYPTGLNLLLYDCGGGTTDIALVNASAATNATGMSLKVTLMGRSGLRDFGGDNITEAVFRLIKARLALAIAPPGDLAGWPLDNDGRPNDGSSDPAVLLRDYLDRNAESIDIYLPTRFEDDRDQVENKDVSDRKNLTLELWFHAEDLKRDLSKPTEDGLPTVATKQVKTATELERTLKRLYPQEEGLDINLTVFRHEVDYLIQPQILRSAKRCNHLIYHKLTTAGQEVHWVVLAGKAVLFPLVRTILESQLDVQFPQDRLQPLDAATHANLKNAVVKGATLALQKQDHGGRVSVEFDRSALSKLPFDIGVHDARNNLWHPLFLEDTLYADCTKGRTFSMQRDEGRNKIVQLGRHWPGDHKDDGSQVWEKYLKYILPNGVPAQLTAAYDDTRHQFILMDRGTPIMPISVESEESWCSPVQRGRL